MRFLIDEDMPRSLAPALAAAGFEALDIRDLGFMAAAMSTFSKSRSGMELA
ncbi:MAG: hypothetical protein AMXMBFR13_31210 [Phycisphaerae bacterium]